ncbi:galactosyltransferase-related protein [Solirubrobacter phytolaccae]|uniref:Galactosyltransferase-related protein n=1 Tax=Solirubrobacter phytolaccae TaxID=1404360 RepID=A0A9X3N927_9ACTN|nr:galactosyltransferase-related protein [Solirubrobacter phytolaccae]MDA0179846.1 galactosyltransferase-related protein [Solirubrobacter phytolaccae]
MRTAVITLVAGRHEHLVRQRAALSDGVHHVVVAMGDGEAARCRALLGEASDVIGVDAEPDGLPLARARNAGAEHALAAGAELLVFLDVDCIPGAALLERYAAVADDDPALLCGPVSYLPPAPPGGYPSTGLDALAKPHPARPVPPEDGVQRSGDHTLFWTLSFAVTAPTWRRIGGFCEAYVGYGGEDTDFGQLAARAGVDLVWVGGAWAYHQHHATQSPPVQHLADIVRNGALFHRRWGWWPMGGWLSAFAERGLVRRDAAADRWVLT